MSAVADHRKRRTRMLQQLKYDVGCELCGDRRKLHFHHRDPSTKSFSIMSKPTVALSRLIAEIEKCDILCERCHWRKHPAQPKEIVGALRVLELNAPHFLAPELLEHRAWAVR